MITFLDSDFSELNRFILDQNPSILLFLVDENTHEFCLPTLLGNLETHIPFEIIEIEAGEELKTLETAHQLLEIIAEFQTDRKGLLVNLGGGVITDLGGFVASIYKRGIPFVHVPTTLLAMCDACIGGKTGVDLKNIKNVVGTFSSPERIFVYPEFLHTLPKKELISGFAEMLKHGLIADEKHWEELTKIESISVESTIPYLKTSMEIKQKIVMQDLHENNVRKILNFGHTFGHAIESIMLRNKKKITHGEAVAFGIIMECKLASKIRILPNEESQKIQKVIRKYFNHLDLRWIKNEDLIELMLHDKKNKNGKISFSLISNIGNCHYDLQASTDTICEVINESKEM